MRTWKPISAALVIFLAGVVLGALIPDRGPAKIPEQERPARESRPGRSGPPHRPWNPALSMEQIQDICGRMTRDLGLTLAQSNQVHAIVLEGQVRMKEIAEEFIPRTRQEFMRTHAEIKGVLTAEQVEKFEADWRARESRWRSRSDDAPGRFGGGSEEDRPYRRGPAGPSSPRE